MLCPYFIEKPGSIKRGLRLKCRHMPFGNIYPSINNLV